VNNSGKVRDTKRSELLLLKEVKKKENEEKWRRE
jgi:hypothetical protein